MSDLSYGPATCLTSMFVSQIVNGPEVLSKFVGETEKNVRDLFADAENEQRTHGRVSQENIFSYYFHFFLLSQIMWFYLNLGDESDLHVIIFDEIDAICKVNHTYPLLHILICFPLISSSLSIVEDKLYLSCR